MSRHWEAEQVYINTHLSQMWPKALDPTIPEALSLALQLDALSDSYFLIILIRIELWLQTKDPLNYLFWKQSVWTPNNLRDMKS